MMLLKHLCNLGKYFGHLCYYIVFPAACDASVKNTTERRLDCISQLSRWCHRATYLWLICNIICLLQIFIIALTYEGRWKQYVIIYEDEPPSELFNLLSCCQQNPKSVKKVGVTYFRFVVGKHKCTLHDVATFCYLHLSAPLSRGVDAVCLLQHYFKIKVSKMFFVIWSSLN